MGKYAIGESRGFLLHSGLMGQVSFRIFSCCYLTAKSYLPPCPDYQSLVSTKKNKFAQNNRLVRVIECPPLRLETPQEWGQVSHTIQYFSIFLFFHFFYRDPPRMGSGQSYNTGKLESRETSQRKANKAFLSPSNVSKVKA